MSGHNKWSGIKHRKGAQDAKRANVFTKFGRLISIAAREGGGNPESNVKLKFVIDQARKVNMPKDNIERAIKKGTGELKDGAQIEEALYEGYGPGNIAMLIKCATDNKNRTVGEIKAVLNKLGGKLVPEGSVSFSFRQMGNIDVVVGERDPYEVELEAIEAGAEDTIYSDDMLTVYTKPEDLWTVKAELEKKNHEIDGASLVYMPMQKIEIDQNTKLDYENMLEKLDDLDDVQEIYDNL
ncbi:MAG: transcriptional regulator [Candidatus Moranbacteria bacterium GW2011_GWE1_49_15]|nr:MAG: transcriptional regulator [Candidatus Moranbacteria bacterium GW2011_GWE2_47_10]KKW07240.1 MAG: transcriptional regulator [Candidatus Moranbacteria bacterium GW2011_GWE1_49_15]HBP01574.1 YebC/PmpR family DNA-binding transcriptional regulator [Candidatus Moranbacteria bacterium]